MCVALSPKKIWDSESYRLVTDICPVTPLSVSTPALPSEKVKVSPKPPIPPQKETETILSSIAKTPIFSDCWDRESYQTTNTKTLRCSFYVIV